MTDITMTQSANVLVAFDISKTRHEVLTAIRSKFGQCLKGRIGSFCVTKNCETCDFSEKS